MARRQASEPGVTVLGLGQMGLVCAGVLASTPLDIGVVAPLGRPVRVRVWGRNPAEAATLAQKRVSPRLAHFRLADEVEVCLSLADALRDSRLVVTAIPVQFLRSALTQAAPHLPDGVGVLSVSKGVEEKTMRRPSEIIAETLQATGRDHPDRKPRPIGCLSGPTIAAELSRCLPAAMVAASDDPEFAKQVQALFTTSWLRVYTSSDLVGVELAGAVKNVIAIAAGVLGGLDAGNNSKSALLARGLAEITRLGVAGGLGADVLGDRGRGRFGNELLQPRGPESFVRRSDRSGRERGAVSRSKPVCGGRCGDDQGRDRAGGEVPGGGADRAGGVRGAL